LDDSREGIKMKTFYFDTGVRPENVRNPGFPYKHHQKAGNIIKNGTLQIPFDAEAPEGSTLMFMCDNPDLPEGKVAGVIVREVSNTSMLSKYTYLRRKE